MTCVEIRYVSDFNPLLETGYDISITQKEFTLQPIDAYEVALVNLLAWLRCVDEEVRSQSNII